MVYLTRVEKFNAAHKLWVAEWSDEENLAQFGKCSNPNWHGHNYTIHVTVKGKPDPVLGFIIDAKKLGEIINRTFVDHVDHRNINLDVPFFPKNLQPTTENLVIIAWQQIQPHVAELGGQLHSIRLYETEKIYADYYGE